MSQAFVKEDDDNGMLHQISPTLAALTRYLQNENNGKRVTTSKIEVKDGKEYYHMNNGFTYFVNKDDSWEMAL